MDQLREAREGKVKRSEQYQEEEIDEEYLGDETRRKPVRSKRVKKSDAAPSPASSETTREKDVRKKEASRESPSPLLQTRNVAHLMLKSLPAGGPAVMRSSELSTAARRASSSTSAGGVSAEDDDMAFESMLSALTNDPLGMQQTHAASPPPSSMSAFRHSLPVKSPTPADLPHLPAPQGPHSAVAPLADEEARLQALAMMQSEAEERASGVVSEDAPLELAPTEAQATLQAKQAASEALEQQLVAQAERGALSFFAMDVVELPQQAQKDALYVLGKAVVSTAGRAQAVSAAVVIRGLRKTLLVVPRWSAFSSPGHALSAGEMEQIVEEVMRGIIPNRRDREMHLQAEVVRRKYAFGLEGVPRGESWYVQLSFPASYRGWHALRQQNGGGRFWSHIFGLSTSLTEQTLLDKRIMGPCWLDIRYSGARAVDGKVVHKDRLLLETASEHVSIAAAQPPPPTGTALSLQLGTVGHGPSLEVVYVCLVVTPEVPFHADVALEEASQHAYMLYRGAPGLEPRAMPHVASAGSHVQLHAFPSESTLLSYLLTLVDQWDPDFLVGHNLMDYTLATLLARFDKLGLTDWDKIGRLARTHLPSTRHGPSAHEELIAGRLPCDTFLLASDLRPKSRDYSLAELSKRPGQVSSALEVLRGKLGRTVEEDWTSAAAAYTRLRYALLEARESMRLLSTLQAVALTFELSAICGILWRKSLLLRRADRVDHLLMHEFHRRGFVLPERAVGGRAPGKSYTGGLVLSPKANVYHSWVLLLDFNSLYPSIIREYNISHETVDFESSSVAAVLDSEEPSRAEKDVSAVADSSKGSTATTTTATPATEGVDRTPILSFDSFGVVPRTIDGLVQRRAEVRRAMQELEKKRKSSGEHDVELRQFDTRQLALKLVANSMYGCLGFAGSRFYAPALAKLVTEKGRAELERLRSTVASGHLLRNTDFASAGVLLDVVYGDTDSVMINTGIDSDDVHVVLDSSGPRVVSASSDSSAGGDPPSLVKAQRVAEALMLKINSRTRDARKDEAAYPGQVQSFLRVSQDGLFKRLLLLRKKKYAVLNFTGKGFVVERKGIDSVRREWCDLSKAVADAVLNAVLFQPTGESIVPVIQKLLEDTARNIRDPDWVRLHRSELVIRQALSRGLDEYGQKDKEKDLEKAKEKDKILDKPDPSLPNNVPTHVAVARKLRDANFPVARGYVVAYLMIHSTDSNATQADRAVPDRLANDEDLAKIDVKYYLESQIFPPVSRICDGLDMLSPDDLRGYLGILPRGAGAGARSTAAHTGNWEVGPYRCQMQPLKFFELGSEVDARALVRGLMALWTSELRKFHAFVLQCDSCADSGLVHMDLCPHQGRKLLLSSDDLDRVRSTLLDILLKFAAPLTGVKGYRELKFMVLDDRSEYATVDLSLFLAHPDPRMVNSSMELE